MSLLQFIWLLKVTNRKWLLEVKWGPVKLRCIDKPFGGEGVALGVVLCDKVA